MYVTIEGSVLSIDKRERVDFTTKSIQKLFNLLKKSGLKDQKIDEETLVHCTQKDQRSYTEGRSFIQLIHLCQSVSAQEFLVEYKLWHKCLMGWLYTDASSCARTAEEFQGKDRHVKGLLDID